MITRPSAPLHFLGADDIEAVMGTAILVKIMSHDQRAEGAIKPSSRAKLRPAPPRHQGPCS